MKLQMNFPGSECVLFQLDALGHRVLVHRPHPQLWVTPDDELAAQNIDKSSFTSRIFIDPNVNRPLDL